MTHEQFVDAWRRGLISVNVHNAKAKQILHSWRIPKRYTLAYFMWEWIAFGTFVASFYVIHRYGWGWGLMMLFVAPGMTYKGNNKSAMQFMIDHALESAEFYAFAVAEEVIQIKVRAPAVTLGTPLVQSEVSKKP